jgi:hypothetical protein
MQPQLKGWIPARGRDDIPDFPISITGDTP